MWGHTSPIPFLLHIDKDIFQGRYSRMYCNEHECCFDSHDEPPTVLESTTTVHKLHRQMFPLIFNA